MIEFIDLFAGIGGFHLGLTENNRSHANLSSQWKEDGRSTSSLQSNRNQSSDEEHTPNSGFRCVWANEWDKYASSIYKKRFPETPCSTDDIRTVPADSIPDHDLLCAGFPCQAFSVAGKRRGFEEARGTLFYEIARIAEHKRTRLLLLENVKGLLSHDEGRTFATILRILGSIGYKCEWQVLNSKWFGVPQNRERVFIIGHLGGEPSRTVFPITETGGEPDIRDSGEQVDNALQSPGHASGNYRGMNMIQQVNNPIHSYYRVFDPEGIAPTFRSSNGNKSAKIIEITQDESQGTRVYDIEGLSPTLSSGNRSNSTGQSYSPKIQVQPVLTPDRLNKRQHGRRFKESGAPSFTLTGQDIHGVMEVANCLDVDGYLRIGARPRDEKGKPQLLPIGYRRIRRLTPLECERLQGFPDNWTEGISDTQRYKCLGNAVTVNVIRFLGERISSLHEKAEVSTE